jgi:hypothetical protein
LNQSKRQAGPSGLPFLLVFVRPETAGWMSSPAFFSVVQTKLFRQIPCQLASHSNSGWGKIPVRSDSVTGAAGLKDNI